MIPVQYSLKSVCMVKTIRIILLMASALLAGKLEARAQDAEIGASLILSGHIMFGPYLRYWITDHHEAEVNLLAAYETQFVFPSAFNAGYHYYMGDNHWRPSIGAQFTLLLSPKVAETNYKIKCIPMYSVMPGIQYRWDLNHLNAEENLWISYLKFKEKGKIFPTGLETHLGYRF